MIVVDVLSVLSCFKLRAVPGGEKKAAYILKAKGPVNEAVIALFRTAGWEFYPLDYEFKPCGGRYPFVELLEDVDSIIRSHVRPHSAGETAKCPFLSQYEKSRLAGYLEWTEKKKVYRSVEIAHIPELYERRGKGEQVSVIIQRSRWQEQLESLYGGKGFRLFSYVPWLPVEIAARKMYLRDNIVSGTLHDVPFLRAVLAAAGAAAEPVKCLFYGIAKYINPSIPGRIGKYDICAIVAGYEKTAQVCDLFWKNIDEGKQLKTLAIVYGYVDDSTYSECGRLADKWVGFERSFGNKGIYSVYYWIWRPYIAALSRNAGKILRVFLQKGMPLEHKARIISVLVTSYKMEALLSETGARIFWTSIEGNDPWSVAGALAANRKGGVSLGSTWSAFRYLSYSAQRVTNDVLFIWGKRHIEIFRRAGTVCGSMVIAGYPGDVYLGEFNSRSDELRKSWLGSYGRKMTICFYTNVFGNNDESLYSVAMDFLGKLFEWALRRDDVLLIVKQKRDEMSRETFPKVKELMERLVEERKLILADNKGDMSPGLASDIVLGIGSATLPLLLGSYGKDVQIIDANRMKERSPLIAGKISFLPGPSEAMEKLESWASSRHDDASPRGDRAFTPNEMDSFADGRAAHRITQYLLDVKDILGKGDGDAAIEGAGERYARKWGKDKIVRA